MDKKKLSKSQKRRRAARAAARETQATEMQITPKSFQVTPETQTTGFSFTPAEKASGNIYGTDIGDGLTAYTQGGPIKDPTNLRAQLGLGAYTAPAETAADSGKQQKQKTARQGGGLRSQLKGMTTDRNLGRKEVKGLLDKYSPQQIVNQFQKLGGKAGLGGGAANLLTKAIQQSPFGNISLAGQNLGMRGFQEGGITEALRGMVGTQRPERNPQSGRTMIGTPGTGPLSRGMQIGPGGQVRAKPQRQAPIAAAPAIAQQGAGEAASSTAAPSTTVMDDFGMAGPSDGDQQYMNMLADFQSALGEMMGGYQTQQQQLMEQFGSMFDNVMNAEAPRLYGVGQNYNIDPIRLAQMLRSRPRGSYMRSEGGALNPMSIASALAPALSGLSAGGVNI
jgi:hypothetical protein